MTNKIQEKIFNLLRQNKPLPTELLSADEKRDLYASVVAHGGSEGFGYDRFFRVGFADWELRGIDRIKQEFITEHADELMTIENPSVNYGMHSTEVINVIIETPSAFWSLINQVKGLQQELIAKMEPLGMCRSTVLVRFKADNWRAYERSGINSLVQQFFDGQAS